MLCKPFYTSLIKMQLQWRLQLLDVLFLAYVYHISHISILYKLITRRGIVSRTTLCGPSANERTCNTRPRDKAIATIGAARLARRGTKSCKKIAQTEAWMPLETYFENETLTSSNISTQLYQVELGGSRVGIK